MYTYVNTLTYPCYIYLRYTCFLTYYKIKLLFWNTLNDYSSLWRLIQKSTPNISMSSYNDSFVVHFEF